MNLREQFEEETKEELYFTFQEHSGASIEEHGFSEEYVEWLEQKLVNKTNDIHNVRGTCKGDYLQKDNSCKKWGGECSKKHCDYYR